MGSRPRGAGELHRKLSKTATSGGVVSEEANNGEGRVNSVIAITIAVLAAFIAVSSIKGSNVAQAMEQAQSERNNSWAWYQAVRVREDMATYELANLQRAARTAPEEAAAALAAEITEQEAEVARVRERKDEVEQRAREAEIEHAALSGIDDQYDLSSAMISIAMALLAVCLLMRSLWLYWFSLLPALAGLALGSAAMLGVQLRLEMAAAWLS